MTAYTSTQAGNWNVAATWGGSGVPGDGDTASIGHDVVVTANVVVGTSPTAGTVVVDVTAGSLTVNSDISFTLRGDGRNANIPVTFNAGSTLEFDSSASASPGSTSYVWQIGSNHNQTNNTMTFNGTSDNRCTVFSDAGGSPGYFTDGSFLLGGQVNAYFTDFTDIGDGTNNAFNHTPNNSTTAGEFIFHNCKFNTCGRLAFTGNINGAAVVSLQRCSFVSSAHADYCLYFIGTSAKTTGTRLIHQCIFDKGIQLLSASDYVLTENQFYDHIDQNGPSSGTWWETCSNNLFYMQSDGPNIGGDVSGSVFLFDAAATNPHFTQTTGNRTFNYTGCIFEFTGTDATGDLISMGTPGAAMTVNVVDCISLPNAAEETSGRLVSALGDANVTFNVNFCTAFMGQQAAVGVSETYAGHPGMLPSFKSNICWDRSKRGYAIEDDGANDSVTDLVTVAGIDSNVVWNALDGSNGNGYHNLEFSTGTVGANDYRINPFFVDDTRDIASWDASLGGAGSVANAIAELKKQNDSDANSSYTVSNFLAYIREGFRPTNASLYQAAHDGTTPGAVEMDDPNPVVPGDDTPQPVGPLPYLSTWVANMQTWGNALIARLSSPSVSAVDKREATYYDSTYVFNRIKEYLNDEAFQTGVDLSLIYYRDNYLLAQDTVQNPDIYGLPGHWLFTHGLAESFNDDGDTTSQSALNGLVANNATIRNGYASGSVDYFVSPALSRETAYTINAYLAHERIGNSRDNRLLQLVDVATNHLNQWGVSQSASPVRVFMVALTSMSLAEFCDQVTGTDRDSRYDTILQYLKTTWDYIWNNGWLADIKTFVYEIKGDAVVDNGSPTDQRDLNLLIAPIFGWLWKETGESKWITRGDLIWEGGVTGAFFGAAATAAGVRGKVFNQNYFYSFDYVTWRATTPVTTPPEEDVPDDDTPLATAESSQNPLAQGVRISQSGVNLFSSKGSLELGTFEGSKLKIVVGAEEVDPLVIEADYSKKSLGGYSTFVAARGLSLRSDSEGSAGSLTLASGTVTVQNSFVKADSKILLTRTSVSGTPGFTSVTIVDGASFTVTSTEPSDAGTFDYLIIAPEITNVDTEV